MIKRQRNHRDTWNVKLQETVAGNYYPITTKIALEDTIARMAILTDRAQGGSSLEDGALELMVHRRLLKDDAFGVGEALNETEFGEGLIARGKTHLFVGQSYLRADVSLKAIERLVQLETLLPSWKFFSNMELYTSDQWLSSFTNTVSTPICLIIHHYYYNRISIIIVIIIIMLIFIIIILIIIITIIISIIIIKFPVHWHFVGPTQICTSAYLGALA